MKKLLISLLAAAVLAAVLGGCRSNPPAEENLPSSQGSSQSQPSQPEGGSNPMEDFSSSIPSQNGGSSAAQPAPESIPPAVPQESSSQDAKQPSGNSSDGKPQEGSASSSAPEQGDSLVGTYLPREDLGAIRLTLTIQEGNRYTLKLSAFLLSGTVSGSYSVNGSQVSLAAEAVNLPGYSAENVGNLDVIRQEDGSLFYPCGDFVAQVGITQESITFVKQ